MSEYTTISDDIYFLNDKSIISSFSDDTSRIVNPIPSFDLAKSQHDELTAFELCTSISVQNAYIDIAKLSTDVDSLSVVGYSSIRYHKAMNIKDELLECTSLSDLLQRTGILVPDGVGGQYIPNGLLINVYIHPTDIKLQLAFKSQEITLGDGDVLLVYDSALQKQISLEQLLLADDDSYGNIHHIKAGVSKYELCSVISDYSEADKLLSNSISSKIFVHNFSENGEVVDSFVDQLSVIKLTQNEYSEKLSSNEVLSNVLYVISNDNIDAYGQEIVNVAEPTEISSAVPKFYVKNLLDGIREASNTLTSSPISLPLNLDIESISAITMSTVVSSIVVINKAFADICSKLS